MVYVGNYMAAQEGFFHVKQSSVHVLFGDIYSNLRSLFN